jgi:radical SAM protein with 4Fe4S-binding SPASM domain
MKRKIKRDPFEYGHLPLYFYPIRAYSRFLAAGKGLDFPLALQIQTQSFCNGRCSICPYPTVCKKLAQGTMEWDLYQKIANRAGTLGNYERLRLKTNYRGTSFLSRLWRRLMTGTGQVTGCHLPFCQMNVLFNGDVIICCHDWNRATVVGNAKTSSLREIWNSKKMNEIRRLILRKRYEQLDSCRGCSLARG